jgi:hypothetical protein
MPVETRASVQPAMMIQRNRAVLWMRDPDPRLPTIMAPVTGRKASPVLAME